MPTGEKIKAARPRKVDVVLRCGNSTYSEIDFKTDAESLADEVVLRFKRTMVRRDEAEYALIGVEGLSV